MTREQNEGPLPPVCRDDKVTPEEFRRIGHQLIDWIADYRAGVADLPGDVAGRARRDESAAARGAAAAPEPFDAILADLDRIDRARPLALAASALLRLFPVQRRALQRAGRLRQHRARRARPVLAIEPRAHRGGGSGHRLDAADDRPLRRLERRHPGHRLHLHAGGAALRPRARHQLQPQPRRSASRARAADRLHLRATATAPWTRPRCWPASAATTCAWSTSTRAYAMRPDALEAAIQRDLRRRPRRPARWWPPPAPPPPRRSIRWKRSPRVAAAARHLAARRRRDGRLGDDPARMPLDVAGHRRRRFAGAQSAQMAGRGVRLLALLRARSRAPDPRDVHQSQLSAIAARRSR